MTSPDPDADMTVVVHDDPGLAGREVPVLTATLPAWRYVGWKPKPTEPDGPDQAAKPARRRSADKSLDKPTIDTPPAGAPDRDQTKE